MFVTDVIMFVTGVISGMAVELLASVATAGAAVAVSLDLLVATASSAMVTVIVAEPEA